MRKLNKRLQDFNLKAVKTLGKTILIVPDDVIFGIFKKVVFKGSLYKCEKFIDTLEQSKVA